MHTPNPQTLKVGDLDVTYYDSQKTHGRDHVMVMIHGTGGNTEAHYRFLFPILSTKQRVIAFDWADPTSTQPNSGAGQELTVADLAEQAIQGIKQLAPEKKVILVGYSLGAVVAQTIAAEHPELVEALVTICGWIKTDIQQELRNSVWFALRDLPDDQALRKYSAFCALSGDALTALPPAHVEAALKTFAFTPFIDAQMQLNRVIDMSQQIANIQCPTLIISAAKDQMVPQHHQLAMFGAIKNSRFVEVDSGHGIVLERPSELVHHIQEFANKPERFPAGSIIPTPQP